MRRLTLVLILPAITLAAEPEAWLQKYCLGCHDADRKKGDIDLSGFASRRDVISDFSLW
jgi:cytochrome c551/c552